MSVLHSRTFSRWARGHLLCRVEGVSDRFALTFDDGPGRATTPAVLDRLTRHEAHATFFLLGTQVRRAPDLVRRIHGEGHEIAIHGDDHWPTALLPDGALRGQVDRATRAVVAAGGKPPVHYRAPFGVMFPAQSRVLGRVGVTAVLGDVYPDDAYDPGVDRIVERTLARLSAGSILILHDASFMPGTSRRQTVGALDAILDGARARGLRAVTVAELRDAAAWTPAGSSLLEIRVDGAVVPGGQLPVAR